MKIRNLTLLVVIFCFAHSGVFAQNEASRNFVQGTVLERQAGSTLDQFPKMEIGFVGRIDTNTNEPMAYLFFRLQSTLEIGGGVFLSYYMLNRNTKQLKKVDGNSLEQFMSLLSDIVIAGELAQMRKTPTIDMELGEIEFMDFQWYMTQNQWKYTRNKICRIKVKIQTVNNEHRLYFYRTSDLRDYRNEFETFTMPNDVYLTERQCKRIVDAYDTNGSFLWKAVDAAINNIRGTMR
jgi:hypothetical protein